MKKRVFFGVLCVILAAVMSFSMLASAADELAFMKKLPMSYETNMTCTMQLNKPLSFLADLQKTLDEEDSSLENGLVMPDLKLLSESVFNMRTDGYLKCSISPDLKKADIYMSFKYNLPAEIYKNLKLTADMELSLWMQYDFTDVTKPEYKIIYEMPFGRKYVSLDFEEILAAASEDEREMLVGEIAKITESMGDDFLSDITDRVCDVLYENAEITKKITSVTVKLDDAGLAGMMRGIGDMYLDILDWAAAGNIGDDVKTTFKETIDAVASAIEYAGLLGEDGVTIKYILGAGGVISAEECVTSVDFNLYELFAKFLPEELIPEWLTPENSDISFDVISSATYENVNKEITVEYPVLTEENSISIVNMISSSLPPDYVEIDGDIIDHPFYSYHWYKAEKSIYNAVEGKIYLGFREAFENVFGENISISYDNGHITAKTADGVPFEVLEFDIGKTTATVDGETVEFTEAPFVKDGVTYISCDFINSVFGSDECASAAICWDSYGNYKQYVDVVIDTFVYSVAKG